jgi:hypothetical protein
MCWAVNATFAKQKAMVAWLTGAKEGSEAACWALDMRVAVTPVVVVGM